MGWGGWRWKRGIVHTICNSTTQEEEGRSRRLSYVVLFAQGVAEAVLPGDLSRKMSQAKAKMRQANLDNVLLHFCTTYYVFRAGLMSIFFFFFAERKKKFWLFPKRAKSNFKKMRQFVMMAPNLDTLGVATVRPISLSGRPHPTTHTASFFFSISFKTWLARMMMIRGEGN